MSQSLYEFLKKDVKKMIYGIGLNNAGNIYPLIMGEVERSVLDIVLRETKFNLVKTAKLLGISRATLYRRLKFFGITPETLASSTESSIEIQPTTKETLQMIHQSTNVVP